MKSSGTFGDEELQESLAKESGAKIEYIRYLEELRHGIIEKALRDGKKVFVKGVAVVSGLRGSFSTVDGEFERRWNLARITVRGLLDSAERLSVRVSKIGLAIRVR